MTDIIEILKTTNDYNTVIYNYYYEELKQYNIDMYKWGDAKDGDSNIINYIMDNINDKLDQKTIDIILVALFTQEQDINININIIKKLVDNYGGNIYAPIKIEQYKYTCFDYAQWSDFGSSYMEYLFEKYEKDNMWLS